MTNSRRTEQKNPSFNLDSNRVVKVLNETVFHRNVSSANVASVCVESPNRKIGKRIPKVLLLVNFDSDVDVVNMNTGRKTNDQR